MFLLPVFPNFTEARKQQLHTSPVVSVNQASQNACCRCQHSHHQSDSIISGSGTQEPVAGQAGQALLAGPGGWAAGGSRPAAAFLTPLPSLALSGTSTTVLVWGKGRLRSMNMRLQVELRQILLFHSMSQQVGATGYTEDALLGFKEKAQESCTDTLCFRLLVRCITVSSADGNPYIFFSPPSLCFFPPLCTSRCLSWRPTPVPRSSLSARSQ